MRVEEGRGMGGMPMEHRFARTFGLCGRQGARFVSKGIAWWRFRWCGPRLRGICRSSLQHRSFGLGRVLRRRESKRFPRDLLRRFRFGHVAAGRDERSRHDQGFCLSGGRCTRSRTNGRGTGLLVVGSPRLSETRRGSAGCFHRRWPFLGNEDSRRSRCRPLHVMIERVGCGKVGRTAACG
jgi:hypothetical protein